MTIETTLDLAANLLDLDTALALVFTKLDPANQHDLGGEAGHFFSGEVPYIAPMDNRRAWGPAAEVWNHVERSERRKRLADFAEYVTHHVLPRE